MKRYVCIVAIQISVVVMAAAPLECIEQRITAAIASSNYYALVDLVEPHFKAFASNGIEKIGQEIWQDLKCRRLCMFEANRHFVYSESINEKIDSFLKEGENVKLVSCIALLDKVPMNGNGDDYMKSFWIHLLTRPNESWIIGDAVGGSLLNEAEVSNCAKVLNGGVWEAEKTRQSIDEYVATDNNLAWHIAAEFQLVLSGHLSQDNALAAFLASRRNEVDEIQRNLTVQRERLCVLPMKRVSCAGSAVLGNSVYSLFVLENFGAITPLVIIDFEIKDGTVRYLSHTMNP